MKQNEAMKRWESGEIIIPVTYVGGSAEEIRWRDGSSGKALTAVVVKHNIVIGSRVAIVNERVPESYAVSDFKQSLAPMSKAFLVVEAMELTKGVPSFRGRLEALTA